MHFYAHLKIASPVDSAWRTRQLRSGWIETVLFTYMPATGRYETGEITSTQLDRLKKNDSVVLEMLAGTVPVTKIPTHDAPGAIQ